MEVRYLITQQQLDDFNIVNPQIKDFPRVGIRVNRSTTNNYVMTIEGTEGDVASFIARLRTMGVILGA